MKSKMIFGLKSFIVCAAVVTMVIGLAVTASATNGYFAHGYSLKHKALGGAGTALPLDSLAASSNPAGMVFVGKRIDAGVTFFNPNRKYTVKGAPSGFPGTFGLTPGTVESDSKLFIIPSLGFNWMMNNDYSLGISIYGNGGMNSDYDEATFWGSDPTGVDLSQLFIVPTYSRKLNSKHAIGISPIIAYQRFQAEGLEAFGGYSQDSTKLTGNDHDSSFGYGARVGYLGEITPNVFLGISYQTEINMAELDEYKGLFAEDGDFDIPRNWSIGLAFKFNSDFTVVLDVQEIYYSEVNSITNPLIPNLQTSTLGSDEGAGFGWEDMTVIKIGAQWQSSPEWTWRAGFSTGNQPIPTSEMLFNILAPGVIEQHVTAGVTKTIGSNQEVTATLVRAFNNSISGPNMLEAPGAQTIELEMNQWELSLGYAYKF